MTLFNGNPVDPEAYEKGAAACLDHYRTEENPVNPYPVHSDQWHSWTKGWNSVDELEVVLKIKVEQSKDDFINNEVTVIVDYEIREVSLMPDGSYRPGVFIPQSQFVKDALAIDLSKGLFPELEKNDDNG